MKGISVGLGLLAACLIVGLAVASATSSASFTVQGDAGNEPLASLVSRERHEFSNGAIARTTVLVGVAGLGMDNQLAQRFVGVVTYFEIEGKHCGDLASMRQVPLTSTEGIETFRSLPRASDDSAGHGSPLRIAHWLVKPLGQKTWGQVMGAEDVLMTFTETVE